MSKEYAALTVPQAKEILADSRRRRTREIKLTVDTSSHLEKRYYAVVTEDIAAASHPLTGATIGQVRIIRFLDRAAHTMELATGDSALLVTINRCTEISFERGTLVIVDNVMGEWVITCANCGPDSILISLLNAL